MSKTVAAEWAYSRTSDPIVHDALHIRATGAGALDPDGVDRFVARGQSEFGPALSAAAAGANDG